jgi:prolyl oligopeptidase
MDYNYYVIDNVDDHLYIQTNFEAPKSRIIVVDSKRPERTNWKTIIPEREYPLGFSAIVGNKIFTGYLKDVKTNVSVNDLNGVFENEVALPTSGTASGFSGKREEQETFFIFTSFTYPSTIYRYDIPNKKVTLFRKSEVKFNPDDYQTEQVFYPSKDGTKIPMYIVHKKGMPLDGNNPTLLYAYGGFNIALEPAFSSIRLSWLEQGGSEYGEAWHEAGMKLKKQNVFDDFIAAAEYLIANKYTSTPKLAIEGGSNGGLLIGAMLCQRPDLFGAAIPEVGVMDMLRYQKFTIGWNWASEYGTSDDSADFKNLFAYSPLHNLKAGVNYPPTLITTADHDDRVVPAHSFKFAATLQAKQAGDAPVLIRIETKSGHGSSSLSKAIETTADIYAFLFTVLKHTPVF